MNEYDAGYGDGYELVGYDEYGQPVYRQAPAQQNQQQAPGQTSYDPYTQQQQQQQQQQQTGYGYDYDPYATGQQPPVPPYDTRYGTRYDAPYDTGQQPSVPDGGYSGFDAFGTGTGTGPQGGGSAAPYDPYRQTATTGRQARVTEQTPYIPQQPGPVREPEPADRAEDPGPAPERDYHTAQFAFVEEPDGDSEDVIDWLAFTENRTERREEARRRARSRIIALAVVLALVAAGGVGYLWFAGKLPGLSSSGSANGTTTAAGAQKRDVIVVHLHNTGKSGTSTVLLVDNTTTKQGTTVLLPNSLALSDDDGTTTTLAKSVDDDGSSGTRDQLDTVLGTNIQGTWRLDTPYLQNLVDLVGNIGIDTDADVPDPASKKKSAAILVHKGKDQALSGKMAVAYATYRASGESQDAQLERFGEVMQGVLRKMSSDPSAATITVQTLAQILDPSLTDKDLGTFLAKLADFAKGGDYKTAALPVQADGTLSAETSASVVKDVLGGTAKSPDEGSAVRVSVQNGSGTKDNTEKARVVLLNGGFTFLDGGTPSATGATSKVLYGDAADKENATEVAKTLGLPGGSVAKGSVGANADVTVVLGQDYKPSSS